MALAFSLSEFDGGVSPSLDQGRREELEERLVVAFLEVGMEYVASESALVDADEEDRGASRLGLGRNLSLGRVSC